MFGLFLVKQRRKVIDKVYEYLEDTVSNNDRDLKNLQVRAAEKIGRNQKYKKYFDKKHKPQHFYKIGDYCWNWLSK